MLLIRYGEIYTKSEPVRKMFVKKLAENIQNALPDSKIVLKRWRIFVYPINERKAVNALKKVFGIVSFSPCLETKADLKEIGKTVLKIPVKETFAVRCQRLSKEFPLTSRQINEKIGSLICRKTKAKVDLQKPKTFIGIEIYENKALVFTKNYAGPRGLPLGTAGKMIAEIHDENSLAAAWLMMKRGVSVYLEGKRNLIKKFEKNYETAKTEANALGIISGVKNLKKIVRRKSKLPIYFPLIGLSRKEIKSIKKEYL